MAFLAALLAFSLVGGAPLTSGRSARLGDALPSPTLDPPVSHALGFVPNGGQAAPEVVFQAETPTGAIYFTRQGYLLPVSPPVKVTDLGEPHAGLSPRPIQVEFLGADPGLTIAGEGRVKMKTSYFIGADPGRWATDLPTYSELVYRDLYPGIDLVITGVRTDQGAAVRLKGTYIVSPGAEPDHIHWHYPGASKVWIDPAGDLRIALPDADGRPPAAEGVLTERAPLAWQEIEGQKVPIAAAFDRKGDGSVQFMLGEHDRGFPLVIDPDLGFSTNLGGTRFDEAYRLVIGSARNVYLLGNTLSTDFPGAISVNPDLEENRNIFVAKLARDGVGLDYSAYIGGSADDVGRDISVDASGDIYITGYTSSEDFPVTTPPLLPEVGGDNVFVTKLGVSGGQIRYSMVLGGSEDDHGQGIFVDTGGQAYVTGVTSSLEFPTTGGLQPTYAGGDSDAFVLKMNSLGNKPVFITYLGGSFTDAAYSVEVDRAGSAYVAGTTASDDFPVYEALLDTMVSTQDSFLTKLTPDGGGFIYSTYLGVGGYSIARDLYVDREGSAYLTGTAEFSGAPGAISEEDAEDTDAFVTRINPDGKIKLYETQVGGSQDEESYSIAVDREGNIYITGSTESPDLPTDGSIQPAYGGNGDAFVAQLAPGGGVVTYHYIGGSAIDVGYGIGVDPTGNAVVAGMTFSPDFPTVSPLQAGYGGEGDSFVLKIVNVEFIPTPVPTATPQPVPATPTPTPIPTAMDALVQSDVFLFGLIGLIALVGILGAVEMNRQRRR